MTAVPSGAAAPSRGPRLSWRRRIAYSAVAVVGMLVFLTVAVLALDIYVHHRVQFSGGVNIWGYRGEVVGAKKNDETRVLALGGSTTFGYGLPWDQSWPYYLDERIGVSRRSQGYRLPVRVVNLGIPADTARTFVSTLKDYAYLHGDIAIFYEGYNDLGLVANPPRNSTNPAVFFHYLAWRHQSPIFRWTGYFPIFPLVLTEKASLLLHGRIDGDGDVAFRPDLAARATAAAMKSAAQIGVNLERRLGKLTDVDVEVSQTTDAGCGRWSEYCGAVEEAVQYTLAHGQRAVVVTQPYFSDLHVQQQRALSSMLTRKFTDDARVRYVNLGRLLDLRDPKIAYDGLHLVPFGNMRVADALLPVVLEMLPKR
jgi:lysophospholipase L1-like esterase